MSNKTHWRNLTDNKYLGAYCMPTDGSSLILTIKEVKGEEVIGDKGKKNNRPVAYFVEEQKPMVLNATNCKAITKLSGSPRIEDWAGTRIEVYVDQNVPLGTSKTEGLRIYDQAPQLPELIKGSDAWNKAVAYLKKGGDINTIKAKYTFNEKELTDAAK